MRWQLCCCGMCGKLLQFDEQVWNYVAKRNLNSTNLNCGWIIFSAMGRSFQLEALHQHKCHNQYIQTLLWVMKQSIHHNTVTRMTPAMLWWTYEGILPKGPYLPCVSMAGRALLAGYPQYTNCFSSTKTIAVKIGAVCILTIMLCSCNN